VDANLYNEQLCLGVAHGLANAAENGDGITVTPIMQDQPQQIRIPILPYGHCLCKRQDNPVASVIQVPCTDPFSILGLNQVNRKRYSAV